jgi:hypothetical protein
MDAPRPRASAEDRPLTDEERQVARKLWPNDEDMEYLIDHAADADGNVWIRLKCSVHGGVMTATNWDLGMMNIAAEGHYIRKHLRR